MSGRVTKIAFGNGGKEKQGANWERVSYMGLSGARRRELRDPLAIREPGRSRQFIHDRFVVRMAWRGEVGSVARKMTRRSFVEVWRKGGLLEAPERTHLILIPYNIGHPREGQRYRTAFPIYAGCPRELRPRRYTAGRLSTDLRVWYQSVLRLSV